MSTMSRTIAGKLETEQALARPQAENIDARWKGLYRVAGIAALAMIVLIVAQCVTYVISPPPSSVEGYFTLFQNNWIIGLLNSDFLYLFNSTIMILIYLALYMVLRPASPSSALIALALGLVATTVFFASNKSFEMLSLSQQYAAATTDAQRFGLLSAGQGMLATYSGTAFDVYYVLNAASLLIFSIVMLRSKAFSRFTSYLALAAGILMIVPSNAGTVGLCFAFASLIPWTIFLFPFSHRLFQLSSPGKVTQGAKLMMPTQ